MSYAGGAGDDVYHTVYDDLIVHDAFKEPILQFHTKFAQCMQPGQNVMYWKHAFESMYLFPWTSEGNNTAATNKFALWAQRTNKYVSNDLGKKYPSLYEVPFSLRIDNLTLNTWRTENADNAMDGLEKSVISVVNF